MYDKNLRPMFNGNVLMNEAATKDAAVMAALRSLQEQNWEFKSHPTLHPLGLNQTHSKEMSVYYTQCLHEVDQCAFMRLTRSLRRGDSVCVETPQV